MSTQDTKVTVDTIDDHFKSWDGGFAGWALNAYDETLDQLKSGDLECLADEVAYSVREGIRMNSDHSPSREDIEPVALEWLQDHREDLIDYMDAS